MLGTVGGDDVAEFLLVDAPLAVDETVRPFREQLGMAAELGQLAEQFGGRAGEDVVVGVGARELVDRDAAALQVEAEAAETRARNMAKRKLWLRRVALGVGIGALLWLGWYILVGRNYVGTDNAYVNAEIAQFTPLIAGTVTEVRVKDTQMVKRGDILVVVGGVIPPQDFDELRAAGAAAIFPPGTVIGEAASELLDLLASARGYDLG